MTIEPIDYVEEYLGITVYRCGSCQNSFAFSHTSSVEPIPEHSQFCPLCGTANKEGTASWKDSPEE